jgi:Protein of unknown function (DUF998)
MRCAGWSARQSRRGPFFLVSVGLSTWASLDYLHSLGWEFVGGEQVPWPSSLACGPYGWAQVATFVIAGLLIVVLVAAVGTQLPRRRASGVAVVLLTLLGVALILAAFRVDVPMMSGGSAATWHGWIHSIAFLLIIATGVLAPPMMALAVRLATHQHTKISKGHSLLAFAVPRGRQAALVCKHDRLTLLRRLSFAKILPNAVAI